MATSSRGSGPIVSALLLVVLAGADAFALYQLSRPEPAAALAVLGTTLDTAGAGAALRHATDVGLLPWLLIPVVGPLLMALVVTFTGRGRSAATSEVGEIVTEAATGGGAPTAAEAGASPDVALRLLATLQEEARLIDFVREDIDGYSDADVGSAARGIHAALRKALDDRVVVEPILPGDDGDRVAVPADFEPALIRITGKLAGGPPYDGVLRHGGWRVRDVRLPAPSPGSDPTILLPAEVEVGTE